jgi:peptidyl-prolyl cis-trans isomerase B (cyclophilin B)
MAFQFYVPPIYLLKKIGILVLLLLVIHLAFVTIPVEATADTVRIGAVSYASLQAAYAVAITGSILQAQNRASSEGLYLNRDIDVNLTGGFDPTFNSNEGGLTTISGPLIVGAGSIVLENLAIAGSNALVSAPDVIGKVQADAQIAITSAGLAVGTITRQESDSITSGSVISQAPSAGTPIDVGAAINLVISSGPPVVTLNTSMGTITITLFRNKAPVTVQNFLSYVQDGSYNGLIFHRVINNFMIQGGGFYSNFYPLPTKPPIVNEANNGLSNKRGTLAMARTTEVDSATSQFFINSVDNTFLDHTGDSAALFGYAVFGEVTGGMDVVDAISAVATQTVGVYYNPVTPTIFQNVPVIPVVILSAQHVH